MAQLWAGQTEDSGMMVDLISLRFGRDRGLMPPPGALALAGALGAAGINWQIQDTQRMVAFDAFSVDSLTELIASSEADVLGLSLFNDAVPLLIAAMDRLEGRMGGRRIFVGGPGTVGVAPKLLRRLRDVEAIVVGEGETILPKLVARDPSVLEDAGVFTRSADGQIHGGGIASREDLNRIPSPAWDWCRGRGYNIVPLATMRGCPFDCKFCEITAFMGRRVTRMSLSRTMSELTQAVACIGSNVISILDDTFTISKPRVLQFCNSLRDLDFQISFSIFSRIDTIDREMLQSLQSVGCRQVFFGIDGGDDVVLKQVAKGISVSQASAVLKMASEYVDVVPSFIWGYPFETLDSFNRMIEWVHSLVRQDGMHRCFPQLHLLSPSAGTDLYHEFSEELIFDADVHSLPICSELAAYSKRPGYDEVLRVISGEKSFGAPFLRFKTPNYQDKLLAIAEFRKMVDCLIGELAIKAVEEHVL